jgi:hypothetical protein
MTAPWSPKHQAEFFTFPNGLPPQILPGDFLQTPCPKTKNAIFRSYLPVQNVETNKGKALLETLRKLTPSVAAKFEVRDDLLGDFTLRLINESSVDVERADDVRTFVALSYCWDNRFEDRRTGKYGEEFTVPFNTLILRKTNVFVFSCIKPSVPDACFSLFPHRLSMSKWNPLFLVVPDVPYSYQKLQSKNVSAHLKDFG